MLNSKDFLAQIESEIERLQAIANLLRETTNIDLPAVGPGRGRPKKATSLLAPIPQKRVMSPEGRQRIVDAQKARHAAKKAPAKRGRPAKKVAE